MGAIEDGARMSALLRVDVDERVALLTLDDAGRRNILSLALVDEIVAAFDRIERDDDVGAVVVTGAPPAFCAGADLSHLADSSQHAGIGSVYEGFLRVARSPLPTIAAVNGAAVGAGMNLALACDVRIAARSARFDTRFLKLGLHPGGGHTWMLRRAVGPQAAAAMVLFGDVLDGAAAAGAGLAWDCVDDDALVGRARRLAAAAAALPGGLVRRTKQTLQAMAGVATHDDAVQLELEAQLWSMQQPEFAERLAAMRARIAERK
jgi:enoyl-CoA hydratase